MYTFRRKPWRFDSGGVQTALYKSIDSGTTWRASLPNDDSTRSSIAQQQIYRSVGH